MADILEAFPDLRTDKSPNTGPKFRYKKPRTISPAARKRMAAGMKKYWAKKKAEKKRR